MQAFGYLFSPYKFSLQAVMNPPPNSQHGRGTPNCYSGTRSVLVTSGVLCKHTNGERASSTNSPMDNAYY